MASKCKGMKLGEVISSEAGDLRKLLEAKRDVFMAKGYCRVFCE